MYRGTATDFSGRTYSNLTPFQAALMAGDIKMAEMMKPYFAHLPDGEASMQEQFTEVYKNSLRVYVQKQEKEIARLCKLGSELPSTDSRQTEIDKAIKEAQVKVRKYTHALLSKDLTTSSIFDAHTQAQQDNTFDFTAIIDAIQNASPADLQAALANPDQDNGSPLCLALNHFRAAFTDLSHSEKVFNPQHVLEAFKAYVNKFDWNNPDWNKVDLFWRQVIGFVQRFLPAGDAQAFAYSLYDIVENKHPCPRSFNFRYDLAYSFYPLSASHTGLGFNFGVPGAGCAAEPGVGRQTWYFSKLMSSKNIKLGELMQHSTAHSPSSLCVVQ